MSNQPATSDPFGQQLVNAYEAFNNGNTDAFGDLCADDASFIAYGLGDDDPVIGWDNFLDKIGPILEAHPVRMTVVGVQTDDVVGWAMVTARFDYQDDTPTQYECHVSRLEDGQVVEFKAVPYDYEASEALNT